MIFIYLSLFVFGLLIGNFATTLLYRLPRNIIPYGFNGSKTEPPFCSDCKHPLRFYEYLPILSWISTKGSCNYCGKKISLSYLYLEITCGFFAVLCAYFYSHNIEIFLLKFCFCITLSLAFIIRIEHRFVPKILTTALVMEAVLFRTLQDQSIIYWLVAFCCVAIFLMAVFTIKIDDILKQDLINIILPASVWLSVFDLVVFIFLLAISFLFRNSKFISLYFYNINSAFLLFLAF